MIYLDNAATTIIYPAVLDAMLPYLTEEYGNASAIYSMGSNNKIVIESARKNVAKLIGAKPEEIIFTSGGSESDNWAIKDIAESLCTKGKHIITTKIEHKAVLNTCHYLESKGFEITYLNVDANGLISLSELEKEIKKDTILISVMFANNEIGTIQPIAEIGAIAKKHGILFHTDAVQAVGHTAIDVNKMGIDLLSASGHKFHAPKGIGFLYVRKGVKMIPLIHGGGQEKGLRGGTENVASIVGMGKAAEIALNDIKYSNFEANKYLEKLVEINVQNAVINGAKVERLPQISSIIVPKVEAESVLMLLNANKIYISSGSACSAGSLNPSYVLKAIGLSDEDAHSTIRVSTSCETTKEEIDEFVAKLKEAVELLKTSE